MAAFVKYRVWQSGELGKSSICGMSGCGAVKRLVQKAKEAGRVIDATQGRRTKAVLITEEDHVILSALQPDTLGRRMSAGTKRDAMEKGEDDE